MPALFAQAGSLSAGWNPGGADPGGRCIPDLASYDQIVESISGGTGTRPHWVYAYLSRTSCRFCALASKSAWSAPLSSTRSARLPGPARGRPR